MDFDIPIVKVEMNHIRKTVMTHMAAANEDINNLVMEELDKVLTEEWVRKQVEDSVRSIVQEAIADLARDYRVKSVLTNALATSVAGIIEKAVSNRGEEHDE